MTEILEPNTDEGIQACFAVMAELRPHLRSEDFVRRVRLQQGQGYRLACLRELEVECVAGFRFIENLYAGRVLYVDDLVTREASRSQRYGDRMIDWLLARAAEEACDSFELDSGTQRHDAHRFYFRKRMRIASYHFRLEV